MTEKAFHALWPSLASTNWRWTHNLERRNKVRLRKTGSLRLRVIFKHRRKCSFFTDATLHTSINKYTAAVHSHILTHIFLAPGWCVCFAVLRLCEDRTGRDKGSSVGVFTANTAEENSLRRWRGSRLMATAKEPELSCCEKSPQSQESEQETQKS